jgi:transposase-like protein
MISRDGCEGYIPMRSMVSSKIVEVLTSRISRGSIIMTAECNSYVVLDGLGYMHETVKCSEREYAMGEAHINNCENRASPLRS